MDITKSISSTFSPKSDLMLADIIKKYNLNDTDVKYLIEKLTMFFSRSEISEKELIDSIQKELGVPQKTAKQIAEEIKNTLIPTLWNNLSQKDRGSLLYTKKQEEKPKEIKKTTSEKLPMSSDIENNLRLESELPKKSVPPLSALTINKKSDGPDRYRESIE